MNELYGMILPRPQLRFSRANSAARHSDPRKGLKQYGPYDSGLLGKDKVCLGLLYPKGRDDLKETLIHGFMEGIGFFPGFQPLFRLPVEFTYVQNYQDLEGGLKLVVGQNLDLVIIAIHQKYKNIDLYRLVKQWLSANGIPSQIVTAMKLDNEQQRQWVIESMALALYAKIGGSPWVVLAETERKEVIIGISRAVDRQQAAAAGYVTLFNGDGDFLYMGSKAPFIQWPKRGDKDEEQKYIDEMGSLIEEALQFYKSLHGEPETVIIHLCKRPGPLEKVAVRRTSAKWNIPYAILHVNDDTIFRMFDTSHTSYIPPKGVTVYLNSRHALLLLDGLVNGERKRRGVPRLVEIRLDPTSTIDVSEFPRLVKQVYNLANMNWRGFNAKASPASLNYSYLIAKLMVIIGFENWNTLISQGKLRDKAWFL